MRVGIFLIFVSLIAGCQSEPERPALEKPVELEAPQPEKHITKSQLFYHLYNYDLDPIESPAKRIPPSAKKVLPEDPIQTVMLVVDNEGWWAMEFSSVTAAQLMENDFDNGFRFRNWYLVGSVSIEVTNKVKKALAEYKDPEA